MCINTVNCKVSKYAVVHRPFFEHLDELTNGFKQRYANRN